MSPRTEALQRQLDAERTVLDTNLKALGARAHSAIDWRARVSANPVPAVSAAAAAGFLLGMASRSRRPHRGPPLAAAIQHTNTPSLWQRLLDTVLAVTASKTGEVVDHVFHAVADRWMAPRRREP